MSEKTTIRTIAAELGMAPATVYRVLSGRGSTALETRRKVIRCARRHGYSLPTRKSGNVAIVVSGFRFFGYLGHMLQSLEEALHKVGFRIQVISESDLGVLDDRSFDGIIFLAWQSGDVQQLPEKYSLPVVSLNAAWSIQENIPLVASEKSGIELALRYLRRHGCMKIFFLGTAPPKDPITRERLETFRSFCAKSGQPFDRMHLSLRDNEMETAVSAILAAKADGVFCASETYAFRLGRALRRAGVRIPDDLSLMGMEDRELNSVFDPPITAVGQDFNGLAKAAVGELIRAMNSLPTKNIRVPCILIERESVKKNPSRIPDRSALI